MKRHIFLLILFYLFFGCEAKEPKSPAADEMIKAYLEEHNISMDQFNQTQDTSKIIFALGEGRSKSLTLARSKAQMDAREKLLWKNQGGQTSTQKTLKNTYVLQYYVDRQGIEYYVKCLIAGEQEKE